jgi:hypothetical protein
MKTKPPVQFIYGLILGVLIAVLVCFFWFGSQKPQPRLTQQEVSSEMRKSANGFNCEIIGEPTYNSGVWEASINCPNTWGGMGLQTSLIVPDSISPPMPFVLAQHCQKV